MTYFLSNWIVIIFEFGGLGLAISLLILTKQCSGRPANVDLAAFRKAVWILIPFILSATLGLGHVFMSTLGRDGIPFHFAANLLTGILFIWFLIQLKRAIQFESVNKNAETRSGVDR